MAAWEGASGGLGAPDLPREPGLLGRDAPERRGGPAARLGASYLLTIGGDDTASGATVRRSYCTTAPADGPRLIYAARQLQSAAGHLGASGTSGRAGASGGGVNGAHAAATDGWSRMGRLTTATGPLAISIAEHRIEPHGLLMMRTS